MVMEKVWRHFPLDKLKIGVSNLEVRGGLQFMHTMDYISSGQVL